MLEMDAAEDEYGALVKRFKKPETPEQFAEWNPIEMRMIVATAEFNRACDELSREHRLAHPTLAYANIVVLNGRWWMKNTEFGGWDESSIVGDVDTI